MKTLFILILSVALCSASPLQDAIDSGKRHIRLKGAYTDPVVIDRAVTLNGKDEAVLDGSEFYDDSTGFITITTNGLLRMENVTVLAWFAAIHNYGTLIMRDCVIANGGDARPGEWVPVIRNYGSLQASGCTFTNNECDVMVNVGTASISRSFFWWNFWGSCVANYGQGRLHVRDTVFLSNANGLYGDYAIYNSGAASLSHCVFERNGGGIRNKGGNVVLRHSIMDGNCVVGRGGGIRNDSGSVTALHSTIQNSSAWTGIWGGYPFPSDVWGEIHIDRHTVIGDTNGAVIVTIPF